MGVAFLIKVFLLSEVIRMIPVELLDAVLAKISSCSGGL